MMDAQQPEEQVMIQERGPLTFADRKVQLKVFAGTVLASGGIDLLLHGGWPGLAAGAAAALIISSHNGTPDVYRSLQSALPWAELQEALNRHEPGERSIADRLMGRHPNYEDEYEDAEPEPLVPILPPQQSESLGVTDVLPENVGERLFPHYPEAHTLRLGSVLSTGQRLEPHVNSVIGEGMVTCAVQGSGKSILNGLMLEQARKSGMPFLALDYKGEYWPIIELPGTRGLLAGSSAYAAKLGATACELLPTQESADAFVARVMTEELHAIVNLPSYGDSWAAKAKIVAEVGKALQRWAAREKEREHILIPCLVLLDEAQLFLPQQTDLLPAEAKRQENAEILSAMNNAYFSLVTNGRSNGYTCLFATQSLTFIAKWAIKSCKVRVFMQHVEKNDLDSLERIIGTQVASRHDVETFPKGVGVVMGLTQYPVVVKFDMKCSRDLSETPDIGRLEQRRAQQLERTRYQQEQVKQARSYMPPADDNSSERAAINRLLESGEITAATALRLISQLSEAPYAEERQEAPYRSSMPAGKLVLPGAQPPSYAAPTQRMVSRPPMREQRAQHLYAVPKATEMEDLPVVEQPESSGHFTSALSPELQRALDTFRPGMSYRDLADAMTERYQVKINKDKAGLFIKQLKERHLITG